MHLDSTLEALHWTQLWGYSYRMAKIARDLLEVATRHAGDRADCNECHDDRDIVVLRIK